MPMPHAQRLAILEDKINQLGKTPPAPWPWADQDPVLRQLQLVEFIEDLEAGRDTKYQPKWKTA